VPQYRIFNSCHGGDDRQIEQTRELIQTSRELLATTVPGTFLGAATFPPFSTADVQELPSVGPGSAPTDKKDTPESQS
jgi:hypothetical protein